MFRKKIVIPISVLLMIFILLLFQEKSNISQNVISSNSTNIISVEDTITEEFVLTEELVLTENLLKQDAVLQPNIISKEDSSMNQPNILNRVTYQPDFYYEDISEDIKKKIYGFSYKEGALIPYEDLRYVRVLHVDFESATQVGEIICNKEIAQDLVEIFYELYQAQYPIEQIHLIDEYNADDLLSMTDNNTSCFNYRVVEGTTKLSKHGLGMALDINPFFNPYVTTKKGALYVSPVESTYYADRNKPFAYKIDKNDLCYQLFTEHGFTWGGSWINSKDYQHFQKELKK